MSEAAIYDKEVAISRSNGNGFLRTAFCFLLKLFSFLLIPGVLFLMLVDCFLFVGGAVATLIRK